jgi:hypothetical protein
LSVHGLGQPNQPGRGIVFVVAVGPEGRSDFAAIDVGQLELVGEGGLNLGSDRVLR